MYCGHCGKEIEADAKFCAYCGKPVPEIIFDDEKPLVESTETKSEEKTTAQNGEKDDLRKMAIWLLTAAVVLGVVLGVVIPKPEIEQKERYVDTPAYQNQQILSVEQEPELSAAEINRIREAGEAALENMYLKEDNVSGNAFYHPNAYPQYVNIRSYVLPYIGRNDQNYWLRLEYNYTGSRWVFWEELTFLVDDCRYYRSFDYLDIHRDNNTDVWEYADVSPDEDDIALLRRIANSNETIVRFEGDDRHYDLTISEEDKQAIKDVLDAYEYFDKIG